MDVRQQILAQATRLFSAHGFNGTSLQDIAEAVGIRKPSLLYHFKSKDELRRAVLDGILSHWNQALPRLLVAATSGEDQFDAILQEMLSFFMADPDRARLLVREVLDRPGDIRDLLDAKVEPWVKIVCDYIRTGQRRGLLDRGVDPEAYVVQVINMVVSSVATFDCVSTLVRSAIKDDLKKRHLRELLRVAKSSLFLSATLPSQDKTKANKDNKPVRPQRSRTPRK